jgi:hypothetical protein
MAWQTTKATASASVSRMVFEVAGVGKGSAVPSLQEVYDEGGSAVRAHPTAEPEHRAHRTTESSVLCDRRVVCDWRSRAPAMLTISLAVM